MIRRPASILIAALLVAACGGGATATGTPAPAASSGSDAGPVSLTVFAASSLQDAVEEAATAYGTANSGTTITVSTGSSAALETQIEQGAPADVFLSADTENAKKLVDGGLALRTAEIFASNNLTIVIPKDNPGGLTSARNITKSGLRIIAAGESVPITEYANQVVKNLADLQGYPPDTFQIYNGRIVSREDSVKAVMAKIELGEGDAAIVYATDASSSDKVRTIAIPDAANIVATYVGVVIKASANTDAAQAFLDWFAGPDGQAILAKHGFLPPPA